MVCHRKTNIILKSLLICSLVCVMQSIAARADSLHSNLIIFGDSLSDSNSPTTNDPGYAIDPRVWGQYLVLDKESFLDSGQLKTSKMTPLDPNNDNINYATGGATAVCSAPGANCLGTQVSQYLGLVGSSVVISPNTDIIIWIGGNDLLGNASRVMNDPADLLSSMQAVISTAITQIKNQETASTTIPYKIYVIDLASLGGIPAFNNQPTAQLAYRAVTNDFDADLIRMATSLSDASHRVTVIDMNSVFTAIVANANSFGLNAPIANKSSGLFEFSDCTTDKQPAQCEGYVFYDTVHPTTAVHAIIAQLVGQAVFPLSAADGQH